jgi:hypothetical protein
MSRVDFGLSQALVAWQRSNLLSQKDFGCCEEGKCCNIGANSQGLCWLVSDGADNGVSTQTKR